MASLGNTKMTSIASYPRVGEFEWMIDPDTGEYLSALHLPTGTVQHMYPSDTCSSVMHDILDKLGIVERGEKDGLPARQVAEDDIKVICSPRSKRPPRKVS